MKMQHRRGKFWKEVEKEADGGRWTASRVRANKSNACRARK